jgi:hypothetical protein
LWLRTLGELQVPLWLFATTAVFYLAACAGPRTGDPEPAIPSNITLKTGRVLTGVDISTYRKDSSVFLNYRTAVPLTSCKEIQAEVREVWSLLLQSEADRRRAQRARVVPEDVEGRSQAFTWVRNQDSTWSEQNSLICMFRE